MIAGQRSQRTLIRTLERHPNPAGGARQAHRIRQAFEPAPFTVVTAHAGVHGRHPRVGHTTRAAASVIRRAVAAHPDSVGRRRQLRLGRGCSCAITPPHR